MKKPRLVLVEWRDAASSTAWFTEQEAEEWSDLQASEICQQVGWLIRKDKTDLVLSASYSPEGVEKYGMLMLVPVGMVTKIITLKVPANA